MKVMLELDVWAWRILYEPPWTLRKKLAAVVV